MKPMRVLYLAIIVVSLSLAFVYYYQYQLKNEELGQYQSLSRLSNRAFEEVSARLAQSQKELKAAWERIERLDVAIASLEKDNFSFRDAS